MLGLNLEGDGGVYYALGGFRLFASSLCFIYYSIVLHTCHPHLYLMFCLPLLSVTWCSYVAAHLLPDPLCHLLGLICLVIPCRWLAFTSLR